MIFQPAIIALVLADLVGLVFLAMASLFAVRLLRHWEPASGSALQLRLERRTYLMSTLVTFVLLTQLGALLLFVLNAERMAPLFVGAMCAVGTLNANDFGFPSLNLRILLFFMAAVWLIMNRLDNRAPDYPLVRVKYALLLVVAPLAAVTAGLQLAYFLNLEADVITSCCGTLFSSDRDAVAGDLTGLAPGPTMAAFYAVLGLTVAAGLLSRRTRWLQRLFLVLAPVAFVTAILAVISFISLYVYEHPHHHCPFCMLQAEYGFVGYGLYIPLFLATALALGHGVTRLFARTASMRAIVDTAGRRLDTMATFLFALFLVAVTWLIASSNLILLGG
ncbi:MAG: hypothetical protein U5S82_01450 [Gammaproteobacteria bacterium]|nr:hypothetical protein [Gammaproteobacteria bacterium]